jgi:hypothetical protein
MVDTNLPKLAKYARLRPKKRRHWPECYHGKVYRVIKQADPTVQDAPGYIWIETPWKEAQSVGGGL